MSHFSRLRTKFVNQEYLVRALKDLGYEPQAGELTLKGFGGNRTPVDILVPLRVSYDIGFKLRGEQYELVADWFGVRGIQPKEFEQKLTQRYAYHAARDQLTAQGFDLVEETSDHGQIRLVLRRTA